MAPRVDLERHDTLANAPFALVQARIDWGDGRRSSGWGRDSDAETAARKALCEAVERHGHALLPPSVFRARGSSLGNRIEPTALIRYDASQYAQDGFDLLAFDVEDDALWLPAQPVGGGPPVVVLADCVCHPLAFVPADRARLITHASTSGCASGFDREGAILRAALELVERDAFMRHWFAQCPGETVAPDTWPGDVRARLQTLEAAGCRVGVQCLTMGLHPTWLAWAQHPRLHFTSVGSASGLDAAVALDTALCELETQALARIEGVPDRPIDDAAVRGPADHAALYATPHYFRHADALFAADRSSRSFDEIGGGFETTAEGLYDRADRAGQPLHWVDLTPPDAVAAVDGKTIHTVRAVAGEMIPMCFGHGRLPLGMDRWHRSDPLALHPFA